MTRNRILAWNLGLALSRAWNARHGEMGLGVVLKTGVAPGALVHSGGLLVLTARVSCARESIFTPFPDWACRLFPASRKRGSLRKAVSCSGYPSLPLNQ